MFTENFTLKIDGEEIPDLYRDIVAMEVELGEDLAGMLRLRVSLLQQSDGTWPYLDDARLAIWKTVELEAGFDGETEPLFSGYVTHVKPAFGSPQYQQGTLEIWAMDGSVLMDREEKLKAWPPAKKDSDIAAEILSSYGFSATPGDQVEDTQVVHDEAVSTIIQRETDMQFLKRLALRNGFECYVDGGDAFFRSPQVDAEPQPLLAAQFGGETNLNRFSLEVNALVPAQVAMFQIDRANKEILSGGAETSDLKALGAQDAAAALGDGVPAGKVFVGQSSVTCAQEMTALCQGLFRQGEWFVRGEGEISANRYGNILKPRAPVTIKGIGETYSGVYYVTSVTHGYNSQGYVQLFKAKRNGLQPTGEEAFSSGGGLGLP